MSPSLLHLTSPAGWRAALRTGVVPPGDAGFVHLSTPDQVALPANRLFAGRRDLVTLVLDPARIGVEIRWEPGVPGDPASMRFPHAYGPVPAAAALAVLPYRPDAAGRFAAPAIGPMNAAGRAAVFESAMLRRTATDEIPVRGGVAVLTAPVPASYVHNQLIVDGDTDAATIEADADRVLGGAGLPHRMAQLLGDHAATAAALADRGWQVEEVVASMAAAGGPGDGRVEHVDLDALRPLSAAGWRRDLPGASDDAIRQLADRNLLQERVTDVRYLAVRDDGLLVASLRLAIDGATAWIDSLATEPIFRRRGHGDALLAEALALAGRAGCDLVGLHAEADDWPRRWYRERGFIEVGRGWQVARS